MSLMLALLMSHGASAQEAYDCVITGGHVIDPRHQVDSVVDVGIRDGRIKKVAAEISTIHARQVISAKGLFVVPGLVDVHAHVYSISGRPNLYAGSSSVSPDAHTFRTGVTTIVDAGTSGWRNFPDFKRRIIDHAQTRVLAWLNIVGAGMVDRASQQKWDDMRPDAVAAMVQQFPELIVGIKTAHYDGPEWVAVDRAIEAGNLTKLPVMVDFGAFLEQRPFQQLVLEKMRPGDTYTHMFYRPVPILDHQGKLLPYLHEARRRGVRFDLGHGRDSFLWSQAVPAVRQGWLPDTISTDLHVGNMNAGMKDMTTCMSKFLNLGVPLNQVVQMSTQNAAELINRDDLGHLGAGAVADVTVLRMLEGEFGFLDARNGRLKGTRRLQSELTLLAGNVVWDLNGLAGHDWDVVDSPKETEKR